jgi:hypothetical protein
MIQGRGRGRSEEGVIEIQSRMEVGVENRVVAKCEAQAVLRLQCAARYGEIKATKGV